MHLSSNSRTNYRFCSVSAHTVSSIIISREHIHKQILHILLSVILQSCFIKSTSKTFYIILNYIVIFQRWNRKIFVMDFIKVCKYSNKPFKILEMQVARVTVPVSVQKKILYRM